MTVVFPPEHPPTINLGAFHLRPLSTSDAQALYAYLRQAVTGILKWNFEQDRIDRVHAFVRVDNPRSTQLLERMGFTHEGRLRNYRLCRGKPYDFNVYSLLRTEWSNGEG